MDILEKYNRYLKDKLSTQEEEGFTRELLQTHFADEDRKSHWKKLLKEEHNFSVEDTPDSNRATALRKRLIIRVISGISIAASILFLVYLNQSVVATTLSPVEQLLSQHLQDPVTTNTRKSIDGLINLKAEADALFNDQQYAEAIPIYEQLTQQADATEDTYFFLGLSYLYDKKAKQAIPQFDWVLAQETSERKDASTWYLTLALVSAKDYTRAKTYLQEVTTWNKNSGQRKLANDAQKLLDAIADEAAK